MIPLGRLASVHMKMMLELRAEIVSNIILTLCSYKNQLEYNKSLYFILTHAIYLGTISHSELCALVLWAICAQQGTYNIACIHYITCKTTCVYIGVILCGWINNIATYVLRYCYIAGTSQSAKSQCSKGS